MVSFEKLNNPKITMADLEALELAKGIKLPKDYKIHMVQHNGGVTEEDCYFDTMNGDEHEFFQLHSLKTEEEEDNLEASIHRNSDFMPADHITIGVIQGGYLAMSVDNENPGKIYVYFSDVMLEQVADSFTEFLNKLTC